MLCNFANFSSTVLLVLVVVIISIGLSAPSEAVAMGDDDSLFLDPASDRVLTVADEVNMKIGDQLNPMTNINNVNTVQTRLTTYLQLEYKNQYNWLVCVAQNFKPTQENVFINYSGKGFKGSVIAGAWTVYWAATPIAPTDSQPIIANAAAVKSQLLKCASSSTNKNPLTASMTYTCLKNSSSVTSGRKPVAEFVFISSNPGPNVSVGNSPGMNALIIITDIDTYWDWVTLRKITIVTTYVMY